MWNNNLEEVAEAVPYGLPDTDKEQVWYKISKFEAIF